MTTLKACDDPSHILRPDIWTSEFISTSKYMQFPFKSSKFATCLKGLLTTWCKLPLPCTKHLTWKEILFYLCPKFSSCSSVLFSGQSSISINVFSANFILLYQMIGSLLPLTQPIWNGQTIMELSCWHYLHFMACCNEVLKFGAVLWWGSHKVDRFSNWQMQLSHGAAQKKRQSTI